MILQTQEEYSRYLLDPRVARLVQKVNEVFEECWSPLRLEVSTVELARVGIRLCAEVRAPDQDIGAWSVLRMPNYVEKRTKGIDGFLLGHHTVKEGLV